MTWAKRLRRLRMGGETLLGLRRSGFFLPYRYAGAVRPPGTYPELAAVFRAAEPAMRETLARIGDHAPRLAAAIGPAPRPRWDQTWFPGLDGAAAFTMAAGSGGTVVEVGSGHSTRFLAAGLRQAGQGRLVCIDPAPRAAIRGAADEWRRRLLDEADLPLFDGLGPGDIAFFDSSHLAMPGTDVDTILNRILPRLAPGVLVHLHDVFLPWGYPEDWAWRGYNEQGALGPWLASGGVEIVFSSIYARKSLVAHSDGWMDVLQLPEKAFESSLWVRKSGEVWR